MGGLIRVAIVDDDPLVRSGLRMILGGEPAIQLVGEGSDGAEAASLVADCLPDVLMMDIRMPKRDGVWATRQLMTRSDPPRILILTTFEADDLVLDALSAGATGFILKDTPPAQMIQAVHSVAAGEPVLSPSVAARVIAAATRNLGSDTSKELRLAFDALSDRDREIALAIGRGLSNAQIGRELYVSVATVKAAVTRILARLDAENRVQIALRVKEAGLG